MVTRRIQDILEELIKRHDLSLGGLSVLTEAASGAYMYTPILAALAGAKKVVAVVADSSFGQASDIIKSTTEIAQYFNIEERIFFEKDKSKIDYSEIDIITNSGFVRPINKEMISQLKTTAVVPLMWETWEYRGDEVDLKACKEHGTLVLGTDESHPSIYLDSFIGMLLLRLLFDLNLSGLRSKILLIASNKFGERLKEACSEHQIDCTHFSCANEEPYSMQNLPSYVNKNLDLYDAIIVAEMKDDKCIIGSNGILKSADLIAINPDIKVGIISGNVDLKDLNGSGVSFFPKKIAPPKYVTYQMHQLGIIPVLELYCAGLKVGQTMTESRLNGKSISESIKYSIENSAAMDFVGELAYL